MAGAWPGPRWAAYSAPPAPQEPHPSLSAQGLATVLTRPHFQTPFGSLDQLMWTPSHATSQPSSNVVIPRLLRRAGKKRTERRKHFTLAVVRRSQKFSPRHRTPFPGARNGQNLMSWRWSLYLHLQTQFGEDRCTQFRVIVVQT